MTETLILQKSPHPFLTLSGRVVFVSIFSSEKNQLQVEKMEKIQEKFSLRYLLKKIQSEKISTSFLG